MEDGIHGKIDELCSLKGAHTLRLHDAILPNAPQKQ